MIIEPNSIHRDDLVKVKGKWGKVVNIHWDDKEILITDWKGFRKCMFISFNLVEEIKCHH